MSCFCAFTHWIRNASALALAKVGSNSAAKIAIMAMTTSNSISVKPARADLEVGLPDRTPTLAGRGDGVTPQLYQRPTRIGSQNRKCAFGSSYYEASS